MSKLSSGQPLTGDSRQFKIAAPHWTKEMSQNVLSQDADCLFYKFFLLLPEVI